MKTGRSSSRTHTFLRILVLLVLRDIKMPRVDGIEVLRRIKSDEKLKLIPVVMLTSSREEKDLAESYTPGVNAYVVKPIDFGEFLRAVKQLGVFWAIINEKPPLAALGEG
jgi:CheY-like chemotaxis protein